jgi:branched-chain amino acid transport system substrate-binding protein
MADSFTRLRRNAALRGIGALAAAIVVAACSSSSSTGSTSNTASSTATAGSATTSSASSTATGSSSAAASGSPINVGIICDCTGAFAGVLAVGAKVYQAWANTVNAAGGINGHPVKTILVDDQSNPGNSLTDVEKLVKQDHVVALVDLSDLDETWASFIKAQNVPVIGANVTEAPFYTNSDFYAEGATEDSLFPGVIDAAKTAGATSIGLLYCAEAVQCQEGVAPMKELATKMGLPLKYNGEVSATAPSYTAQCVAAQQAGVQALFIADIAAVAAKVAQNCSQQGYHPIYVVDGVILGPSFQTTPGLKDNLVGPIPDLPYYADSPENTKMNAAIDKYYPGLRTDANYSMAGPNAWTAGTLLEAAAEAGGLTASDTPTSAELVTGLTSLKGETLNGIAPSLTYAAGQAHPIDCWFTYQLKNGVYSMPNGTKQTCATG